MINTGLAKTLLADGQLLAILDSALAGESMLWRNGSHEAAALFENQDSMEVQHVGPYLVALDHFSLQRLLDAGWGLSWGVFLTCKLPFVKVLDHLRGLLRVRIEDGEILYFRFYDPRVLRVFLHTCTKEQLGEIFGPISAFWMEGDNPFTCLVFRVGQTGLEMEVIDLRG